MRIFGRVIPVLSGLLAVALFLPGVAAAGAEVVSDVAPPPPKAEHFPPPRDGYVWGAGYWEWRGHAYYWVSGHWVVERRHAQWIADHWEPQGAAWHYLPGHWQR